VTSPITVGTIAKKNTSTSEWPNARRMSSFWTVVT
jgi:hypothetical protein